MRTHRNLSLARAHDLPRIEVIATGNELLDGTISDTNTQRLALALKPFGLKISRTTVILDQIEDISRSISEAVLRSDIVVVSGGLGPTTDDITLEAAANAFGVRMLKDRQALKNVLNRLKRARRKPNAGNLKQAWIPEGSVALQNLEGTAPGIQWKRGDRNLFFLPGVPREFDYILKNSLVPFFSSFASIQREYLKTLKIYGVPESELSAWVGSLRLPSTVRVGFRTHLPENHIKFDVRARSKPEADRILKPILVKCRKKFGLKLFSENGESFGEILLKELLAKKKTLSIAESCTGGLTASMVTSISGSSAVFHQGFVTYSNESKMKVLGVRGDTLQKFGAVSEQTAKEMAEGARLRSRADVAVAITGIAGPTGGTKQKPVGTVWFACATPKRTTTQKLHFPFARDLNQRASAYQALQMIREAIRL